MRHWLWTWDGTSFGYREGTSLFTHNSVEAGRFHAAEIYGADGAYIGEVKSGKLITDTAKKSKHKGSFASRRRVGGANKTNRIGTVGHVGFDNFPSPESFR
jgi:hypothetical protein